MSTITDTEKSVDQHATSCHPEKWILRTSDRMNFRKCRQYWDFTSKVRMNYEPLRRPHYFEFGISVHEGFEVFYDPEMWNWDRDVVTKLAIKAFVDNVEEHRSRAKQALGGSLTEEEAAQYDERIELGIGMFEFYRLYSAENDHFIPVYSEIEFEVPVHDPGNKDLYLPCHECGTMLPVVYQGRVDLIVKDEDDLYWIVDHKTTARMDSTEHVEMDPQISSYVLAMQRQLGIKIEGFIYSEVLKGFPDKPAQNKSQRKGRWLSVNKAQNTTYELYMQAIEELGEPIELYEDILKHFKVAGPQFVRRTQVHRNSRELDYVRDMIYFEAFDMFYGPGGQGPLIYPNPSRWNCRGCSFRTPCLLRHEKGDYKFLLESSGQYTQERT